MRPVTTEPPTTIATRRDNSGAGAGTDLYVQLLAGAQMEAAADAVERLNRAYAAQVRLLEAMANSVPVALVLAQLEAAADTAEAHVERIVAARAFLDSPPAAAGVIVSPGQLRLVVGG